MTTASSILGLISSTTSSFTYVCEWVSQFERVCMSVYACVCVCVGLCVCVCVRARARACMVCKGPCQTISIYPLSKRNSADFCVSLDFYNYNWADQISATCTGPASGALTSVLIFDSSVRVPSSRNETTDKTTAETSHNNSDDSLLCLVINGEMSDFTNSGYSRRSDDSRQRIMMQVAMVNCSVYNCGHVVWW